MRAIEYIFYTLNSIIAPGWLQAPGYRVWNETELQEKVIAVGRAIHC